MSYHHIVLLAILITHTSQKCMLVQDTVKSQARAVKTEEEMIPKLYKDSMDVCHDFINKDVCCTEAARSIMAIQFVKLEMATDCQTCVNNLKRFL